MREGRTASEKCRTPSPCIVLTTAHTLVVGSCSQMQGEASDKDRVSQGNEELGEGWPQHIDPLIQKFHMSAIFCIWSLMKFVSHVCAA